MVRNPPANAGDKRDAGSIPGSGRSLEEGMATHSSVLARRTPWTEELLGYPPWGRKELDMTECTHRGAWLDTHFPSVPTKQQQKH